MGTYELNVSSLRENKEMGKERGKSLLSLKENYFNFYFYLHNTIVRTNSVSGCNFFIKNVSY